jgi:hypothetical protein
MAKSTYKIPASIDRSFVDHEITVPFLGFQSNRMPIKQLLALVSGAVFIIWSASSTFIKHSGVLMLCLYVLWALLALIYLSSLTKTKELRATSVPAAMAYIPKSARYITTRQNSDPSDFYSIVGIDEIKDNGQIKFAGGAYGHMYLVVGSASNLLFDEDRSMIINRVDSFWRKVPTPAEFIFLTNKEPQRVHTQVANLERDNLNLRLRDPDLLELQNEKYEILTEHVGAGFTSIHQYVLIKGKSAETLRQAQTVLASEVESSSLMIKEATMLDRSETIDVLSILYQSVDRDPLQNLSSN